MKFTASSSLLLKHLQQISGVISTNSVLPVLEDFLFDVNNNTLTVTATDLETVMRIQVEITSTETGKVCIPSKVLLEVLKNLPDQPLTFSVENNYAIEITSSSGKYRIVGETPDNFPKEPVADDAQEIAIKGEALVTAINKTLFAVSNDDLRPAMTGVYFELTTDAVQFVATDAHRLVRYKRTDAKAISAASFIVPKKPLNLLKNVLPDTEDEVKLSYNASYLFVEFKTSSLICRLIDARFPDYKVVIPAENPYHMVIDKGLFQNALRRINVFATKSTNQVALTISGTELQLAAQDIDLSFEGNETLSCEYNGEDIKIAFNAKFLIEMLNAADTSDIRLELSTPNKAGLIKPTETGADEDLLMLVMPLMLNS